MGFGKVLADFCHRRICNFSIFRILFSVLCQTFGIFLLFVTISGCFVLVYFCCVLVYLPDIRLHLQIIWQIFGNVFLKTWGKSDDFLMKTCWKRAEKGQKKGRIVEKSEFGTTSSQAIKMRFERSLSREKFGTASKAFDFYRVILKNDGNEKQLLFIAE